MKGNDLISYEAAAEMFKAAALPSSTRTVRRHIWSHPYICPLDEISYHTKRVRRRHVAALIKHLLACGKGRAKSLKTTKLRAP